MSRDRKQKEEYTGIGAVILMYRSGRRNCCVCSVLTKERMYEDDGRQ